MLLTTFTLETLTGCQNLDAFQKSTYVEHLANELVLMETTINIYNYGGHTGLYKFHSFHSHNNNMVLLSRHSADTSPFFFFRLVQPVYNTCIIIG